MGVVFVAEIVGANLFARMFETTAIDKGGMGGDCSGVGNTWGTCLFNLGWLIMVDSNFLHSLEVP